MEKCCVRLFGRCGEIESDFSLKTRAIDGDQFIAPVVVKLEGIQKSWAVATLAVVFSLSQVGRLSSYPFETSAMEPNSSFNFTHNV
jgi:hypothetical protein